MNQNNPLTAEEVAQILKIAKNTVYELVKRGELPAYKVGRKLRINSKDLDYYMNGNTAKSNILSINNETLNKKNDINLQPEISSIQNKLYDFNTQKISQDSIVLCGRDPILDLMSNHLQKNSNGIPILRSYIGSFDGLLSLYKDSAQIVSSHLWASDTNTYNVAYVRRFLPGIPCIIIHLAKRYQGFYVAKGNPKNINTWVDLTRNDISFINVEKGTGSRVLLDEKLRSLCISSSDINGYNNEEVSHLSVASAIGRGTADVSIGSENLSKQVSNIDFIPMQQENYDLVIKKSDMNLPIFQMLYQLIKSETFIRELEGLGNYDLSDTGMIVAET
jgi:putative molybdopterin biosynthesis protein